ncbi:MAG: pyridoxamine 5'-phosphate oxidase family protein [Lachnospiraceae bacterium]|nr:pyridoxamine 5'-phosphate oxidase family protein [Lachnospiraceae bacterium]MBR0106604.1 pyridoxamine 5'-phosphate oxidase family protein [Lachnospiraceae bacterium]MBR0402579.1 pyridoxamine 5'-phosphate oxidase family protein [Lachnospiraceae bacterium]
MFREMNRKNQALTEEECIRILTEELRGVLSVNGDDGYPYGSPIDHYYHAGDGKIYFHSAKFGHRVDAMKADPRASFCVHDSGFRREGEWALNIRSVIVFGRLEIVEDREKAIRMARQLCYKFTDDEAFIEDTIAKAGPHTLVFALVPEHMTGKIVNES